MLIGESFLLLVGCGVKVISVIYYQKFENNNIDYIILSLEIVVYMMNNYIYNISMIDQYF